LVGLAEQLLAQVECRASASFPKPHDRVPERRWQERQQSSDRDEREDSQPHRQRHAEMHGDEDGGEDGPPGPGERD
jgi:hypothetical protein